MEGFFSNLFKILFSGLWNTSGKVLLGVVDAEVASFGLKISELMNSNLAKFLM